MNLKIKTKDIDIEFQDECTTLQEDTKKRIIEVAETVLTQQLSLEQVRREQEELDLRFEEGDEEEYAKAAEEVLHNDSRIADPMWFSRAKNGGLTEDFVEGYSQAVYQIRLYISGLVAEPTGEIRTYASRMLEELNKVKNQQDLSSAIVNSKGTASAKPSNNFTTNQ